jgi:RNA polymerase sigma factor (sigma-70 family)
VDLAVTRGAAGQRIVEAGGGSVPSLASTVEAVTRLEREHGDALFGFARRLGIDDATAADSVQEGLLRLYDELVAGRKVDDPRAWIFTVVYRIAMDEHRRRARSSQIDADSITTAVPPVDPVELAERQMVWSEVDRLPERQRAVLYLRYRADLPFDLIGRVLGITSSAARSHATQAVASLRTRLGDEGRS